SATASAATGEQQNVAVDCEGAVASSAATTVTAEAAVTTARRSAVAASAVTAGDDIDLVTGAEVEVPGDSCARALSAGLLSRKRVTLIVVSRALTGGKTAEAAADREIHRADAVGNSNRLVNPGPEA